MEALKTPPPKRKARASLGTAIKRSIQTTRKDPGSAGKKRRVVVATQKNIARALNNDNLEPKIASSIYEGRITRARNAASSDAPKETPSRMLRQLSKVLPRPPAERQTPRRNSIRAGMQKTPGSVLNSTRRPTKKPNIKSKNTIATKKPSPQDLLRQLTRAPGFVQVPDVPVKVDIDSGEVESKQENNLLKSTGQSIQNNTRIQQFVEDEQMDIETQLHDKMDNSDDEIPNYFDQITETMEFTGEVINDRNNMGIEFNAQVQIQPPDEIFNKLREHEFDDSVDNNEVIDAFNSPLASSSRFQEGDDLDNFWLERNSYELNNLTFDNKFNGIRINENSERRNGLLNELLRSSLDKCDSENYILHDNSLEKQSRVQLLFNNSKRCDFENIISLDPLVNEPENERGIQLEGDSINNNEIDLENETTAEVRLDGSYCQSENYMEIIYEPEEIPKSVNEPGSDFDNDHLNIEQEVKHGLNDSQRNKRMRMNKSTEIVRFPNSLIKSLFHRFSNIKMSKEAMQTVFEGMEEYFTQISNDLNTYASHAKREIIQEKDVLLLMKRQRLITEKTTFESLVERYLPRELSDEIYPYARAGNIVYPKKQLSKKGSKKAK